MPGISVEFILMLSYAFFLAAIALVLEFTARHAHRRSASLRTVGFTYHPERDIWKCPEEQHLFPVYSDTAKGLTVYRAPAATCNACPSKAACTDSDHGREIERRDLRGLQYGMQRFHRAFSLTLLVLATAILAVEIFRAHGVYPRAILAVVLAAFCGSAWRLLMTLMARGGRPEIRPSSSAYFDSPRRTS